MRPSFLPFAQPDLGAAEIDGVVDVLKSGWITTGAKVKAFEQELASLVGAKHGLALNSCTAAMHLALEAIGLQKGDEVITTPYTFAATAEVVRYFGATPVFVDVMAHDLNIDVDQIEAAITARTKAIIPVHVAGLPADLARIYAIAEKHNLAVIEDAAHSFPSYYQEKIIGSFGRDYNVRWAVCFSFYATKTITTGEGGMLVTDDPEMIERCRIMALHGISKDAWKRYTSEGSWYYEIVAPGFKYNMTDIMAALGLAQLERVEEMKQRRHEIALTYNKAFAQIPEIQPPVCQQLNPCAECVCEKYNTTEPTCPHSWHLYMLRLNLDKLLINRKEFVQQLKEHNIGVSVHFIPLHIHPYYAELYNYEPQDYPVAYNEYMREISLPIYSKMTDDDVQSVIDAVKIIVEQSRVHS